ncbi:PREDICTED: receptor-type tyrosine-protein phosphatase kappa-like, partial [Amphimedon queenslandica]|uniref:Protein-tyrosine-phosphatase n=1 Tax=Amphimedon queenslandica TaxID=400682 RepID=A0AAN0JVM6_AMPQE
MLYNFTIRAFNELGGGESASVSAFSKPDTLLLSPPERVEATLSHDKTTITVSWDSKTFDEVGAFFAYKVTATTTSTRKRQSGSPIEMIVPYNTTSVSFTGVNPNLMYQITASYIAYSQNGSEMTGPPSNPVTPVNAVSSSTSSMQTVLSTTSVTSSPTLTPTLFEDTKNSPYIIGAAIGGLLVIFIILIIIVLLGTVIHRRRHTTGKMTLSTTNDPIITSNNEAFELTAPAPPRYDELTDAGRSEHLTDEEMIGVLLETEVSIRQALNAQPAHLNDNTLDEDEEQEIAEEPVYVNIGDHNEFKPIHVSVFHSHVLEMHSNSDQEFDNEFKSIPMTSGAAYTVGSSEANIPKNRFLNIFPYDATRVVLTTKRDSDYINACFVDGYARKNCYIAAQGNNLYSSLLYSSI